MYIHCSQKLLDLLKLSPEPAPEAYDPLLSWHAHIITIKRRKTIVLMCESNMYTVVIHGVVAKDIKNIDSRIKNAIRDAMLFHQINPEVVDQYLAAAGEPKYISNSNSSVASRLNAMCDDAKYQISTAPDSVLEVLAAYRINRKILGKDLQYNIKRDSIILEELERFGIQPVLKPTAFKLTARLELMGKNAVRKLVVPATFSFEDLHMVLQAAFEWKNYHLHEFVLYDSRIDSADSLLVYSDSGVEQYHEGDTMVHESNTLLKDYITRYKNLYYLYDFGDDWEHHIKLTSVVENYTGQLPALLSGSVTAPPEDVGGMYGYDEFLQIISDPANEDYESTKAWADGQMYKEFELERVQRIVEKYALWSYGHYFGTDEQP